MELSFKDAQGTVAISESVFNTEFNQALVHQVIVAYQAGGRQGTRAQKTRAEVSGSTKKPWRQKKTGNARAGDKKSPLWRSGGVTFAAKPQNFAQKVNKKMYRAAIKSIFSELLRQDRLLVVKSFELENHKTKNLIEKLNALELSGALIIDTKIDTNVILASRNLHKVGYILTDEIDPVSLIKFEKVVLTEGAVKELEEALG